MPLADDGAPLGVSSSLRREQWNQWNRNVTSVCVSALLTASTREHKSFAAHKQICSRHNKLSNLLPWKPQQCFHITSGWFRRRWNGLEFPPDTALPRELPLNSFLCVEPNWRRRQSDEERTELLGIVINTQPVKERERGARWNIGRLLRPLWPRIMAPWGRPVNLYRQNPADVKT